jgi:hypothetical protein
MSGYGSGDDFMIQLSDTTVDRLLEGNLLVDDGPELVALTEVFRALAAPNGQAGPEPALLAEMTKRARASSPKRNRPPAVGPTTVRHRVAVIGAAAAGVALGMSGLAAADILPDPIQHVASVVLEQVGIDVPDPDRPPTARRQSPGGRPATPPGRSGEQPGNRPEVPPGQVEDGVPGAGVDGNAGGDRVEIPPGQDGIQPANRPETPPSGSSGAPAPSPSGRTSGSGSGTSGSTDTTESGGTETEVRTPDTRPEPRGGKPEEPAGDAPTTRRGQGSGEQGKGTPDDPAGENEDPESAGGKDNAGGNDPGGSGNGGSGNGGNGNGPGGGDD